VRLQRGWRQRRTLSLTAFAGLSLRIAAPLKRHHAVCFPDAGKTRGASEPLASRQPPDQSLMARPGITLLQRKHAFVRTPRLWRLSIPKCRSLLAIAKSTCPSGTRVGGSGSARSQLGQARAAGRRRHRYPFDRGNHTKGARTETLTLVGKTMSVSIGTIAMTMLAMVTVA
jgi:hypothetical protein